MNTLCESCGSECARVCGMDEEICPNCGWFRGQEDTVDTRLAWVRANHLLEWCEKCGDDERDDKSNDKGDDESNDESDDDICQHCDSGKPSQFWDYEWGCEACLKPRKLCPLCQNADREKDEVPLCSQCTGRVKLLPNVVQQGCGHWILPCAHYRPQMGGLAHADQWYCETDAMECVLCEEGVCVQAYYETLENKLVSADYETCLLYTSPSPRD